MCWSGEASAVLAAVGLGTTVYAAYKKEPPVLWMALGYFSLMELLQAFTYSVIDNCSSPSNQVATLFGYLHIAFQPFFINALSMHFIPERIRKRIEYPVYAICFASTLFMLIQLYPFDWAGTCDPQRPLCGERLCSVSGDWHIAWEVPTNGIGNYFVAYTNPIMWFFDSGFVSYMIAGFIVPFLYGSWRFTLYHLLIGPFLSMLLTENINERPAIWCLLSIGILLLVVKTPLRRYMHVREWPLYPR